MCTNGKVCLLQTLDVAQKYVMDERVVYGVERGKEGKCAGDVVGELAFL